MRGIKRGFLCSDLGAMELKEITVQDPRAVTAAS